MLKRIGKRLKDQRGLTLVELLAVILILGIIAAIAVPSIGNIVAKSKYDAAKADAIQLLNAGSLYVAANGTPESTALVITKDSNFDVISEFIEITEANLDSWTLTINTTGEVEISATSKQAPKAGTAAIAGTVEDINNLKYETGA